LTAKPPPPDPEADGADRTEPNGKANRQQGHMAMATGPQQTGSQFRLPGRNKQDLQISASLN